jgi:Dual specificity phosphatase, catalytic domain
VRLRPVYIHPNGGSLYQSGSRYLANFELEDKVRILAEIGIAMIINVSSDNGNDLEMYARYRTAPFGDNQQFRPKMPFVMEIAREAAGVLAEGRSVLTQCQYGINRSGLTNALIIRECERCTGAEAFQILKMRRPGACGGNPHFAAWLIELPCP